MIETRCGCGKVWKSSDGARGRTMPCPGCGAPTVLGGAAAAAAPARHGTETSRDAIERAEQLANAGRADEARRAYERAIELEPNNGGLHYLLANHLMFGMRLLVEAKDVYLRALRLWDDPGTWTNLGLCMAVLGYPDKAVGCFDRALQAAPHPIPLFYKAYALMCAEDRAASQACLQEARALDPGGQHIARGQALLANLRG